MNIEMIRSELEHMKSIASVVVYDDVALEAIKESSYVIEGILDRHENEIFESAHVSE
jgi:hypothetical protein